MSAKQDSVRRSRILTSKSDLATARSNLESQQRYVTACEDVLDAAYAEARPEFPNEQQLAGLREAAHRRLASPAQPGTGAWDEINATPWVPLNASVSVSARARFVRVLIHSPRRAANPELYVWQFTTAEVDKMKEALHAAGIEHIGVALVMAGSVTIKLGG